MPTKNIQKNDLIFLFLQDAENVKTVYKQYLKKKIEALGLQKEYKRKKIRKLDLEIKRLEKDVSAAVNNHNDLCGFQLSNCIPFLPTGCFKLK